MAISTDPPISGNNPNLLSNVTFNFSIDRFPGMNFYVQSISLPGVSISQIPIDTGPRRIQVQEPPAKVNFEPMTVTFMVDEDMTNYIEIFNWLNAVGGSNPSGYKDLKSGLTGSIKSTILIDILTSHRNSNIKFRILDAFPTQVEALTFDFRSPSVDYQPMTVNFSYNYFTIES